ncbi:MAG: glycosyltransferase [Nitrososphaerota archaeon]|nr:glycosyltransferase [Nitrososphaerota archaeon]
MQPSYAIVIPTFNESKTIDTVLRVTKGAPVYVVDDGSNDGTREIVAGYANAKLVTRDRKMGLVSAYLDGMKEAIKQGYDYFVVMDGDGQHDPKLVDDLVLAAQRNGADLVIGSRYVKGGDAGEGFSAFRKLVSRVANYLFMLSFDAGVMDATSGYRVYSRRAVEHLLEHRPRNSGYAGQVEIVEELSRARMKVVEHGMHLKKRVDGTSKLGFGEIMNYFLFVLTAGNLWKYALVGLSGILVNEAALYLLSGYMSPLIADILAIEISILSNFFLNESWTFSGRRISKNISAVFRRLYVHNAAAAAAIVVNFAVFALLELVGVNLLLANLIGIIVAFSFRYLLSSRVVWVNE